MDVRIAVSRKLLDGRMQRVHCRSIADDVSHDIAGDALIAPRVCEMFRMEDYTDGRGENARNVRKARLNDPNSLRGLFYVLAPKTNAVSANGTKQRCSMR